MQDDLSSDFAGAPPSKAKKNADEPVMHFYDAAGKRVQEGDPSAVKQFLSNDANRPVASKDEKEDSGAKPIAESGNGADPNLLYYDAAGKRVKEPVSGGSQYLPTDENRPDAKPRQAAAAGVDEAEAEAPADTEPAAKATKPAADKARKSSANKAKK